MSKKKAQPKRPSIKAQDDFTSKQMYLPFSEQQNRIPNLSWPTGNHEMMALNMLMAGKELRQINFKISWRLAAIVHALKERGWPVLSTPTLSNSQHNKGRAPSVYTLKMNESLREAIAVLKGGKNEPQN